MTPQPGRGGRHSPCRVSPSEVATVIVATPGGTGQGVGGLKAPG